LNCQATRKKSSTICISSLEQAIGPDTFDTLGKKWRQAAHWALPFFGKVEYVPELGLWFGLSACNPFSSLCALDLSAIDSPQVYLGLYRSARGRAVVAVPAAPVQPWLGQVLCCRLHRLHIPNSVHDSNYEATFHRECAIFTGLEVKRGNDGDGPLQFIKHMSKRFSVGDRNIECVL